MSNSMLRASDRNLPDVRLFQENSGHGKEFGGRSQEAVLNQAIRVMLNTGKLDDPYRAMHTELSDFRRITPAQH